MEVVVEEEEEFPLQLAQKWYKTVTKEPGNRQHKKKERERERKKSSEGINKHGNKSGEYLYGK